MTFKLILNSILPFSLDAIRANTHKPESPLINEIKSSSQSYLDTHSTYNFVFLNLVSNLTITLIYTKAGQ